MEKNIKLVALDLDGTLLNEAKHITKRNAKVVSEAVKNGVEVVAATGRSYVGLPLDELSAAGIRYAITANGASVYKLPERECIYSSAMSVEDSCQLLGKLKNYDIHLSIFVEGDGYSEHRYRAKIQTLNMPENMKQYMERTRVHVDSMEELLRRKGQGAQKITLNFTYLGDGIYQEYEEVFDWLLSVDGIDIVTGGYHNLEITRKGTTKGNSLKILADRLGIGIDQTMACGDSQNDIDIMQTAGIGIAMGNATEDVKAIADDVTLTNEEDGVAMAIKKWVL